MTSSTLIVFLSVCLYLSFQIRGISMTALVGDITVTLAYSIILLLGVSLVFYLGSRTTIELHSTTVYAYFLLIMFLLWVTFGAFRSPQPARAFTLVGLLIMMFVVLTAVSLQLRTASALRHLNYCIYVLGAGLSTVVLILYLAVLSGNFESLIYTDFINYQLIAMPANAVLYRLTGFVGDPHFYSWYASLALFCGLVRLSGPNVRPSQYLGVIPLAISILLAMSRTFYIAVFLTVSIIYVITAFTAESEQLRYFVRRSAKMFGKISAVGIVVGVAMGPQKALTWIQRRLFATVSNDKRFTEKWPQLLESAADHPFIGAGSREVEVLLDGTAHNAYLGIFHDFGLIGLLIWGIFLAVIFRTILSVSLTGFKPAYPWLLMLFITLAMNVTLSFQYEPFWGLIAGVIVSPSVLNEITPSPETDSECATTGQHTTLQ